jgi:hypothetical protein
LRMVIRGLLECPGIDIVAGRSVSGGVLVCSKQGQAMIRMRGEDIWYRVLDSDPFGYDELPVNMTAKSILRLTYNSGYPDAPLQLLRLFRSARAGDLVISAAEGFDLKDEIPAHHSSHGSLHRPHMLVPLLCNRPIRRNTVRTVDVFSAVLDALGKPHDDLHVEGESFL